MRRKHLAQLLNHGTHALRLGRGTKIGMTDGGVDNGIHSEILARGVEQATRPPAAGADNRPWLSTRRDRRCAMPALCCYIII
jgi:hypothetical protein